MTGRTLNRIVRVLRAHHVDDGYTEVTEWVPDRGPLWAHRATVTESERLRSALVQNSSSAEFIIRWTPFSSTITPADRLFCEGRTYSISGIEEDGHRVWLHIMAVAVALDES